MGGGGMKNLTVAGVEIGEGRERRNSDVTKISYFDSYFIV
jgi:hypothetical protein